MALGRGRSFRAYLYPAYLYPCNRHAVGDADIEPSAMPIQSRYSAVGDASTEQSAAPMFSRHGAVGDADMEPTWRHVCAARLRVPGLAEPVLRHGARQAITI